MRAVARAVRTFAASIYVHSKLYAAQFEHLPDVVAPSPGRPGGRPSDQRGQEGSEGTQLTAYWKGGGTGGVMIAGGEIEEKWPCVLFLRRQVSHARWILRFLAFASSPGADFA